MPCEKCLTVLCNNLTAKLFHSNEKKIVHNKYLPVFVYLCTPCVLSCTGVDALYSGHIML